MLDPTTKYLVIILILVFFVCSLFFMVCLLGPFPLNRLIFGDKLYSWHSGKEKRDSKDSLRRLSKTRYGSCKDSDKLADMERMKCILNEYEVIDTSLHRAYDSVESSSSGTNQSSIQLSSPKSGTSVIAECHQAPEITLVFRLHKESEIGRFTLTIDRLNNCPGSLLGLWYNTYIVAQVILPQSIMKRASIIRDDKKNEILAEVISRVVSQTSHPVFNEQLHFTLDDHHALPNIDWTQLRLRLCAWNCSSSLRDTKARRCIGRLELGLHQVDLLDESLVIEKVLEPYDSESRGEILLSVSYLPTSEKLNLVVLKARGLRPVEHISADPYVNVELLINGMLSSKKKHTRLCIADLNPIFNETMLFDLPSNMLNEVVFVIQVMHCVDKINLSSSTDFLLGACALGNRCYGLSNRQWSQMRESPRKHVTIWHKLA